MSNEDDEKLVQSLAKHDGVFADDARNTLSALKEDGFVWIPATVLENLTAAARSYAATYTNKFWHGEEDPCQCDSCRKERHIAGLMADGILEKDSTPADSAVGRSS